MKDYPLHYPTLFLLFLLICSLFGCDTEFTHEDMMREHQECKAKGFDVTQMFEEGGRAVVHCSHSMPFPQEEP